MFASRHWTNRSVPFVGRQVHTTVRHDRRGATFAGLGFPEQVRFEIDRVGQANGRTHPRAVRPAESRPTFQPAADRPERFDRSRVDHVQFPSFEAHSMGMEQLDGRLSVPLSEDGRHRLRPRIVLADRLVQVVGNVDVVVVIDADVLGRAELGLQGRPVAKALLAGAGDSSDLAVGRDGPQGVPARSST